MTSTSQTTVSHPLYPEAVQPWSDAVFADPPAVYRGAPFWSWNCRLERERLLGQFDALLAMGLGGGHIHPRTGLATPYLGEEFLGHVLASVEHAAERGAKVWLYDEDRWPSGFAGGLVTSDPRHRVKALVFSPEPLSEEAEAPGADSCARHIRGHSQLLARYAVTIVDGFLTDFRRLGAGESCRDGEDPWFAYNATCHDSTWFNHQAYVDVLSPAAIARFIEVTHEAYAAKVGGHFGTTIPAIFTDEPQTTYAKSLATSSERAEAILPWTDDLADTYRAQWGEDLLDHLPELVFERADHLAVQRWRFRDHVAERFASAFADQIGAWCADHGIRLTGHLMAEQALHSQCDWVVEAMRQYRGFQLPGIDLLCDALEFTTAKQAQSAVHQDGREGMLSELYGVTNWDFPFSGHKRQGDWQAALGVTVRCHHLTWVSMAGNAKRDYPASMGPHVPWHPEYPLVENHFARLNTVLTRGRPQVRLAVVHPIESHWLCRGPVGQCQSELEGQEQRFQDLTNWLLHGLLDFDFLAESRLPEQQARIEDGRLVVGQMAYEAVVVPALRTIRQTTLDLLEAFQAAGGTVVWAGRLPDYVDGLVSDAAVSIAASGHGCDWSPTAILPALEHLRDLEAVDGSGARPGDLLHQWRGEGDQRHLFVCCLREDDATADEPVTLRLRGTWAVTENDTLGGERRALAARHVDGWTEVGFHRRRAASLCLSLAPTTDTCSAPVGSSPVWREVGRLVDPVPVTLAEPNVLLLDRAAWRLPGEPAWRDEEELLRLTNTVRAHHGWPRNHGGVAQPWAEAASQPSAETELRFRFVCDVAVVTPRLVVERLAEAALTLDGVPVANHAEGWYVDPDLPTAVLPDLAPGPHELIVKLPLSPVTTFEWCYLLGDFGVALRGRHARIVAPVRELAWGDAAAQGLPFYGGNITYHARLAAPGGPVALRCPAVGGAVTTVDRGGQRLGAIAFDPHRLELGRLAVGCHDLDVTVHGTRVNTFGALHNRVPGWRWWGPKSWETSGSGWTDGYQLRPTGMLVAPMVEVSTPAM